MCEQTDLHANFTLDLVPLSFPCPRMTNYGTWGTWKWRRTYAPLCLGGYLVRRDSACGCHESQTHTQGFQMYIPITGFFYLLLRLLSKITKVYCCQGRERRTKDFDVKKPSYLKSPIEDNSQRTGFEKWLSSDLSFVVKKSYFFKIRGCYTILTKLLRLLIYAEARSFNFKRTKLC